MTGEFAAWSAAVLSALGLVAAVWRGLRGVLRIAHRVDEVVDDWQGTPARPGVPERPGVLERIGRIEERTAQIPVLAARLEAVEHELHPNAGTSLRDAMDRVDRRTARLTSDETG